MFKGIYNVYFAGLQFFRRKDNISVGKNRAHLSCLFLNIVGLCDFP